MTKTVGGEQDENSQAKEMSLRGLRKGMVEQVNDIFGKRFCLPDFRGIEGHCGGGFVTVLFWGDQIEEIVVPPICL
ncbi:hypothetical protein Ddc_10238 [Ditylenchus destructor]|nr:hypothetical protein Ddc_10238 [Ditylenchus destructor]